MNAHIAHKPGKRMHSRYSPTGQVHENIDLIFYHGNGWPMDARNLGRRFNQLVRIYGHPQLRFHDLRYTYAPYSGRWRGYPKRFSTYSATKVSALL